MRPEPAVPVLLFFEMLIVFYGIPGAAPLEAMCPEQLVTQVVRRYLMGEINRTVGIFPGSLRLADR